MSSERSILGKKAEDLAAKELVNQGYEIVEKNYRCRYGEIDIIARDAGALVFVEVRSRRSATTVSPAESIGEDKQSKLVMTAMHYLSARGETLDPDCRFDVVEVRFQRNKPISVEIIKGAFGEN